eukprot:CAMPEP_0168368182 /NCGR_PEP_ID=MMETSP0228-20121227/6119_1 /TAXON_ID=133427 /ORGANISM="Protoceratium reticulatum, Strain CCCM 535 (=CCMP 1889)" /LENGTH=605 /DNA_ID=CAMNT_0008381021 /DNA_START=25 /DNA_END=1841 /DNA_ORIENTATION=+
MDFDDLDEAQEALGPGMEELRQELMKKQVPESMPGARKHPRPNDKGYGGGSFKSQKVLYLYGPGCNEKMAERQTSALFKNVPWIADFKLFEWHYWEGEINNKVEEIHADPAVAAVFIPFGKKCGSTYDGYMSYVFMAWESHNTETWLSPEGREKFMTGKEIGPEDGYLSVLDKLAKHLEETGPYDGLCGFDMGGCLAFEAARLAQEGDPRFVNKFRYLMLFSTRSHKDMALLDQGKLRPKAPLMIPTYVGWSLEDDSKQYSHYEDLALYIHPDYRGIFYHDQGHRPPNVQKGTTQCAELDSFIGAMQADTKYRPQDSKEVQTYRNYWLPLVREPLPAVAADEVRRLIIFPDPFGEHGPLPEEAMDRMRFPAQEDPMTCHTRLGVYRAVTGTTAADFTKAIEAAGLASSIEVIEAKYTDDHKQLQWHPKVEARDISQAYAAGQGRSRWLQAEDEVVIPWGDLKFIAEEILETISASYYEKIGVVGLGTGAHVAVAVIEAMLRLRSCVPVRFFPVCAPTVWPQEGAPDMGMLVTTPIRYLTCPTSVAGAALALRDIDLRPFLARPLQNEGGAAGTCHPGDGEAARGVVIGGGGGQGEHDDVKMTATA